MLATLLDLMVPSETTGETTGETVGETMGVRPAAVHKGEPTLSQLERMTPEQWAGWLKSH